MAFTVSIELPSSMFIRNDSKGKAINLPLEKVPAAVIAELVTAGATVILNNTYNGGGKERQVADKEAAMLKRMDAWLAGSFTMIERGESQYTAMREQYYAEQAERGKGRGEVDKAIKATVADVLGKEVAASFSNFLEAVARIKFAALPKDEAKGTSILGIREEIEKALAERTAEAARKRAELAASLKIDAADLGL